jgi:hypothetical protein
MRMDNNRITRECLTLGQMEKEELEDLNWDGGLVWTMTAFEEGQGSYRAVEPMIKIMK